MAALHLGCVKAWERLSVCVCVCEVNGVTLQAATYIYTPQFDGVVGSEVPDEDPSSGVPQYQQLLLVVQAKPDEPDITVEHI